MVETIKCDHCGAEARHVVTKEFDGKVMNFCCRGCLGVYEMMREEGLLQAEAEEKFFTTTPLKKPEKTPGRRGSIVPHERAPNKVSGDICAAVSISGFRRRVLLAKLQKILPVENYNDHSRAHPHQSIQRH